MIIKGKITMHNGEVIPFELYPDDAPITVENFVKLIKEGYYNGKTFHRVIPHFVSQGGCPYGTGAGDLGYTIPCETMHNPNRHVCCQFFICHEPQPHLDGVHTVFGKVTDNMKAVTSMRNGDVMDMVEIEEA